jgi:predicted regulator of Ras-like GTPase activity (Roadblock/LC7/MglB family)
MVRALRDVAKAEAVALLHRDGSVLAADLPRGVSQETFSIMCAAILGAAMTAATELHHSPPHRVILESEDSIFLISEVGRRAMVVVAIPPERPVSELIAAVERFAQAATRLLE